MTSIGVVSGNEALSTAAILSQLYEKARRPLSVCGLQAGEPLSPFQMLIVNHENKDLQSYMEHLSPEGILIINGDNDKLIPYLKGRKTRIVTYGYNLKSCITASSITPDEIQCCIQRLLLTFSQKALEPQEFTISIPNKNIYAILGAVTAALLDDVYQP